MNGVDDDDDFIDINNFENSNLLGRKTNRESNINDSQRKSIIDHSGSFDKYSPSIDDLEELKLILEENYIENGESFMRKISEQQEKLSNVKSIGAKENISKKIEDLEKAFAVVTFLNANEDTNFYEIDKIENLISFILQQQTNQNSVGENDLYGRNFIEQTMNLDNQQHILGLNDSEEREFDDNNAEANSKNKIESRKENLDIEGLLAKILDKVHNLLENEPNPFVLMHLKSIFEAFAEENFYMPVDVPFSDGVKTEVDYLAENLKKLKNTFPCELKTNLKQLKTITINSKQNDKVLWEPAQTFLKLPSIMSLSRIDSRRIVNIIENIQSSKDIEEFLKEKYENGALKQEDLEKEVGKLYKKNLNTLMSQIYLKKPKDESIAKKIFSSLNNLNIFKGKQIFLSSLDYNTTFIGQIRTLKLENNGKIFMNTINSSGEEAVIHIYFDSHRILRATIINKNYKTLKETIYSHHVFKKKNDVIMDNSFITKNKDFLFQKTSILEDGNYKITVGPGFRNGMGHYLFFHNLHTGKKIEFEISHGAAKDLKSNIRDSSIYHKDWDSASDLNEFLKYFKVLSEETTNINFSSESELEQHLQISQNNVSEDESNIITKKTEEIFKLQSSLICILIENSQNGCLFDFLIDLLLISPDYKFKNKNTLTDIDKRQKGKAVLEGINDILRIKKSLGQNVDELEILTDIVRECNYIRLINKEQGIKTERLMGLLTKGMQITEKMKDKSIIAFFGNTGSGKSTTVNFFAGVPLVKSLNDFGEKIINIDEKEFKGKSAKIGHSLGISETLYAQAYKLLEGTYDEKIISNKKAKNTFLCDNPGFRDTRGSDFEVCTNLSIDQAVLNCSKLQAAVIVLPFSVFLLDRGNHLVEVILNLEDRFPDLLDEKSTTHSSVFLAITKYNTELQIEGFNKRLKTHIDEENRNINEYCRNEEDLCALNYFNKRLKIFTFLLGMSLSNKIFFVNVEDQILREEQFSKLYKCQGIDKSKYNRSMEKSEILKKFSDEINKTCHTWHKLILERYLTEIPNELKKIREMIKELQGVITGKKNDSEEIKKSITKWKKKITDLRKKKSKNDLDIDVSELTPNIDDEEITAKKNEVKQIEEKLESARIKLQQKESDFNSTTEEISQYESKLKSNREKVQSLENGETDILLIDDHYEYEQEVNVTKSCKERLEKALREVQPIEFAADVVWRKFKIGFEVTRMISSQYIEKKFRLVPENTNFDEDGKLEKYQGGGLVKAQIQSHLCKLTNVNSSPDGKKVVIQYQMSFNIGTDLPFLKVSHMIPNNVYNADHIINLNSEIDLWQSKISTLNKYKNDLTIYKDNLSQGIKIFEKQIKQNENIIKNISAAKSKELKIKQIDEEIEILEQRISDSNDQMSRNENERKKDEDRLAQAKTNLKIKEKEKKKIALLIWDQLEKNIPQSLLDYINIAYDIENKRDSSKDTKNIKEAKKMQYENFEAFKKVYLAIKDTLLESVSKDLKM